MFWIGIAGGIALAIAIYMVTMLIVTSRTADDGLLSFLAWRERKRREDNEKKN